MINPTVHTLFSWSRLGNLRQILDLVSAIRELSDPITSADGLRKTVALLLRLAESFGIDSAWTDRLGIMLRDEDIFNIVLALVRYALGGAVEEQPNNSLRVMIADGNDITVNAQSLIDWLPIVLQLIALVRQIRGAQ